MALINKLNDLGDSIRAKTGKSDLMTLEEMAAAVDGIESIVMPDEAFVITGYCGYKFMYGGWDWYVEEFGDKITTKDVSTCTNMFGYSELEYIPFDINASKNNIDFNYMFEGCKNLLEVPNIYRKESNVGYQYTAHRFTRMFYECESLREIPNDFFNNFMSDYEWNHVTGEGSSSNFASMFERCRSLRSIPDISKFKSKPPSYGYSYAPYYNGFAYCLVLDKAMNLPVIDLSLITSNGFNNGFIYCNRLKNITFTLNEDGSPIVATWKNQTIDLTSYVGYANKLENITNYNSGITTDKLVTDDASYQALKDDEDWFTTDINYSRYNHDSAVATINSLPDVSSGSGNTIKFKGAAGALTDGGAINTLTEEEIAVAAAKGWTVTLT